MTPLSLLVADVFEPALLVNPESLVEKKMRFKVKNDQAVHTN